ncbi:PilW family protein [Ralstonia soli]|uniref:PilW family protein n=1 Tax=Ralstonia soli TaxID=2953896 RepID=A0ABT1AJ55_9RALS|nr:PilW family protein [Ralstonia soli]MCO5398444.1 PilW family protein [Ralstonia soli]
MPRPLARRACGVSLVELLVGMVIALMVLGIALQLTLIARARYLRLADEALIQDRGMQALDLIRTAVNQAGWVTDTPTASPTRRWPSDSAPPSLVGWDNCGNQALPAASGPCPSGLRGSDALLVRFAGRGKSVSDADGDGATRDCAGYPVPERDASETDPRLGYILLYVARSSDAAQVPQLMCRSLKRDFKTPPADPGRGSAMVRGVETLQLLYTLAPTATALGETVSARDMTKDDWYRVQQIEVSLVVRGERFSARTPPSETIELFPEIKAIRGAPIKQDLEFRPTDPHRNRARFTATLAVRNPLHCEADVC